MMEKTLLLIDDRSEHVGLLDIIKNHMQSKESITLQTYHINPIHDEFWNDEKDPDLDKLILGIKNARYYIRPDLILVDQYYSDCKFKGTDVIEKLRKIPKFNNCSIFIISGNREQIVRDIFDTKMDDAKKVENLAVFLSLRIDGFFDKDFRAEAIRQLKQSKLESILPTKLRDYDGDNTVVNCFTPKYKTLSFSELADKIEGDAPEAKEILDEMFGITLSHYANINEKL